MRKDYSGLLVQQRRPGKTKAAPDFFVTLDIPAGFLDWAEVQPTFEVPGGAQRLFSQTHAAAILNYLEDGRNVIPTAVTLALPPQTYTVEEFDVDGFELTERVSFARLIISSESTEKIGRVIDGQHRLRALEKMAIPILASIVLATNQVEQALQFVVINNKAKKVPSDLVKAILGEMSSTQRTAFEKRVARIRLSLGNYERALKVFFHDKKGPFFQLIDWDLNRKGERVVKPLALETALKTIMVDLRLPALEMDDAIETLSALWLGVKDAYSDTSDVWGPPPSKLLSKAVIVAVTEYLVSRLNMKLEDGYDATDLVQLRRFGRETLEKVPSRFWVAEWGRKSLDTSAGRRLIRDAIGDLRRAFAHGEADPLVRADWFLRPPDDTFVD